MSVKRRRFLAATGLAALAVTGASAFTNTPRKKKMKDVFIHHVFFWLQSPASQPDRDALMAGLTKLSAVKTIRKFHIGQPADTNRDVIERGYAISWLVQFDNAAGQASYQTDPVHLQFVKDCSHLWSKVIVYDSVDAA